METTSFRFGIELEVVLTHKRMAEHDFQSVFHFGCVLIDKVNAQHSQRAAPQLLLDVGEYRYRPMLEDVWVLRDEATIHTKRNSGQWPAEFVSPIFLFNKESTWRKSVGAILKSVGRVCHIQVNDTCGMHVHVSPPEGVAWDLNHLKSICRSIFYFEGAINALVPPERRNVRWAGSNTVENSRLRGGDMDEWLQDLNNCANKHQLVCLINDNGRRNFAWNFTNLWNNKGTIEFRQAPGTRDAFKCYLWVEFVLHFINSSQKLTAYEELLQYPRNTRGLLAFLSAFDLPGSNLRSLRQLFRGKRDYVRPVAVREFTDTELESESE